MGGTRDSVPKQKYGEEFWRADFIADPQATENPPDKVTTRQSAEQPRIEMSDKFEIMIKRIAPLEGGYLSPEEARRQGDPGGETHWGISKRAYPDVDIKNLTWEGAVRLYRRDYWDRVHGDQLPNAIAYAMLDAAINSGWTKSIMWLQEAVGVADDGKFGPMTLAAVQNADPADVMLKLVAQRLEFMTRLSNWPVNSRGWARRMAQILRYGAEDN